MRPVPNGEVQGQGTGGHVLFVEPEIAGHQSDHLRMIEAGLRSGEWGLRGSFLVHPDILAAGGERARGNAYVSVTHEELRHWVERPLWRQSFRRLAITRRYAARLGVDHVHFMNLDHMQLALALGGTPGEEVTWSGTLFRPFVHYPWLGHSGTGVRERLRRMRQDILVRQMLKRSGMRCMFTLDPFFPEFAETHWDDVGGKVLELPDPAMYGSEAVTGALPEGYLPDGKTVFTLFGTLSRRKGVLQTVRALDLLDDETAGKVAVVLAGSVRDDVREELYEQVARLRTRTEIVLMLDDRRLSDGELTDLVARSDVVLAPYQRFVGSSGVLLWAAAAGKPVLTQDYGTVGRITEQFGLGLTVDTRDPTAIADGISRLSREPERFVRPDDRAAYVEPRTPEAFAEVLLGTISAALGSA